MLTACLGEHAHGGPHRILDSLFSSGTQQDYLSFSTVIPTTWAYFCWSYAKFLKSSIGCAIEIHTSLLFRHLMSTVGVIYCPETIPSLTDWMDALSFSLQLQKSWRSTIGCYFYNYTFVLVKYEMIKSYYSWVLCWMTLAWVRLVIFNCPATKEVCQYGSQIYVQSILNILLSYNVWFLKFFVHSILN